MVGCMGSILYEWSISHISHSCLWLAVWAQSFMSGQYPTFFPAVYGWLYGLNPLWVVNIPHFSQLSMVGCMGSILYEWSISHISPSCLWMAVWAQSFMSGQYPTFLPAVYGWLYGLNPLWVVNIPHLTQLSMVGCMGSIHYEWSISHISPSCLWLAVWAQSFMSGQYPTFIPAVYGWLYGLNTLWVINIPHFSQLSMVGCMGSILYEWSISHISPSCLWLAVWA